MGNTVRSLAGVVMLVATLVAAGCGGGGGSTSVSGVGSLTADGTGTVAAGAVTAPAGVTLSFPASSTLTTAGNVPVTGTIATTVTCATTTSSLPGPRPADSAMAVMLDISMTSGANEVKNLSTPLSVTVTVPAGITSVDVYSYNGSAWSNETAGLTVSNGTVSFTISHLSTWACFSTPLSIGTASPLAAGMVGVPYSQQLAACGGQGPYTWSGTPPTGLTLSGSGLISGTPVTAGTFTFTVTASDTEVPKNSVSTQLSLTVNPPVLTITTASLPDGTTNTAYSTTVQAAGGTTPYSWSATGLPTGLTINSTTGIISGKPTVAGTFNSVVITVTDAASTSVHATLSLTVVAGLVPVTITTATLPVATFGSAYAPAALAASGGTGTITWSLAPASGPLPANLTLNANGTITGTPSAAGASTSAAKIAIISVVATDSLNVTATKSFAMTVIFDGATFYANNCAGCHASAPEGFTPRERSLTNAIMRFSTKAGSMGGIGTSLSTSAQTPQRNAVLELLL